MLQRILQLLHQLLEALLIPCGSRQQTRAGAAGRVHRRRALPQRLPHRFQGCRRVCRILPARLAIQVLRRVRHFVHGLRRCLQCPGQLSQGLV